MSFLEHLNKSFIENGIIVSPLVNNYMRLLKEADDNAPYQGYVEALYSLNKGSISAAKKVYKMLSVPKGFENVYKKVFEQNDVNNIVGIMGFFSDVTDDGKRPEIIKTLLRVSDGIGGPKSKAKAIQTKLIEKTTRFGNDLWDYIVEAPLILDDDENFYNQSLIFFDNLASASEIGINGKRFEQRAEQLRERDRTPEPGQEAAPSPDLTPVRRKNETIPQNTPDVKISPKMKTMDQETKSSSDIKMSPKVKVADEPQVTQASDKARKRIDIIKKTPSHMVVRVRGLKRDQDGNKVPSYKFAAIDLSEPFWQSKEINEDSAWEYLMSSYKLFKSSNDVTDVQAYNKLFSPSLAHAVSQLDDDNVEGAREYLKQYVGETPKDRFLKAYQRVNPNDKGNLSGVISSLSNQDLSNLLKIAHNPPVLMKYTNGDVKDLSKNIDFDDIVKFIMARVIEHRKPAQNVGRTGPKRSSLKSRYSESLERTISEGQLEDKLKEISKAFGSPLSKSDIRLAQMALVYEKLAKILTRDPGVLHKVLKKSGSPTYREYIKMRGDETKSKIVDKEVNDDDALNADLERALKRTSDKEKREELKKKAPKGGLPVATPTGAEIKRKQEAIHNAVKLSGITHPEMMQSLYTYVGNMLDKGEISPNTYQILNNLMSSVGNGNFGKFVRNNISDENGLGNPRVFELVVKLLRQTGKSGYKWWK